MSDIAIAVGKRIRAVRKSKNMSIEALAARSGLHSTYIGQLERGEKNATLTTLEKVSNALDIPMKRFVEFIPAGHAREEDAARRCYNLILEQEPRTQRRLHALLNTLILLLSQNQE